MEGTSAYCGGGTNTPGGKEIDRPPHSVTSAHRASREQNRAIRPAIVLALSGVSLFLACATAVSVASLSPEEQSLIQTRKFDQPDSTIFSAVLGCVMERGYMIQVCDRADGLIQTAALMYQSNAAADILSAAMFGAVGRFRRTLAARVKDGVVRLNFTYESEAKSNRLLGGESGWEPAQFDTSLTNGAYRQAFDMITERLTGHQATGQPEPKSVPQPEPPRACTTNIVNGTIAVQGIRYDSFLIRIAPSMSNARLTGSFMASGGKGNDIVVLVVDEKTFHDWSNLYGVPAERFVYNSGKVTMGSFDVLLPASGYYYLVCSNVFSSSADKHVMIRADLSYVGQRQ
jgi:hypothetical protein